MRTLRVLCDLCGFLVCSAGLAAAAGDAPLSREAAACLVQELAEPVFEKRDAAFAKLLAAGAEDPEGVLALLARDPEDPDARDCVRELRKRIPWEARKRKALAMAAGAPELIAAIGALYENPSPKTALAVAAKADGCKPAAARALADFLVCEDRNLRMAVLKALPDLEDPTVASEIAPFLEAKDVGLQRTAAVALLRLCGQPAGLRTEGLVERARDCWKERAAQGAKDPPPAKHPCTQPPSDTEISE